MTRAHTDFFTPRRSDYWRAKYLRDLSGLRAAIASCNVYPSIKDDPLGWGSDSSCQDIGMTLIVARDFGRRISTRQFFRLMAYARSIHTEP